jgi:hypothetical protein
MARPDAMASADVDVDRRPGYRKMSVID